MELVIALVVILLIATPVMALIGAVGVIGARGRIADLERRIDDLQRGLDARGGSRTATPRPAFGTAPPSRSPEPTTPPEPAASAAPPEPAKTAAPPPPALRPAPAATAVKTGAPSGGLDVERHFAQRWMVWFGGLVLAAGGLFLARWAAERGYLGPLTRVSLAIALGLALTALGERLRAGREERSEIDYVPGALAAAGLTTLYGATLAAHRLYDLVGPLAAFAALGAISVFALVQGLKHGWLVALAGLAGGYAAPLLVASPNPNDGGLSAYLLALALIAYLQAGQRRAPYLAWTASAGSAAFGLLMLVSSDVIRRRPEADLPIIAFALALIALAFAATAMRARDPDARRTQALARPEWWLAATGLVVATLVAERAARPDASFALLEAGLVAALFGALAAALRFPKLIGLAWLGFALAALHVHGWSIGYVAFGQDVLGDPFTALDAKRWLPTALEPFFAACFVLGAGFFAVAIAAVWRGGPNQGHWASLAAAAPVAAIAIAHARTHGFGVDLFTAAIAAAIAGGLLAATTSLQKRGRLRDPALGALATGVAAAIAASLAMALDQGWLTSALAGLLLAIALIDRVLDLPALGRFGAVIAAIVAIRAGLVFSWFGAAPPPSMSALLSSFGLPFALAFAAGRLARPARKGFVIALDGAALALFLALLVEAAAMLGQIGGPGFAATLLERAAICCGLLAAAIGLARRERAGALGLVGALAWPLLALGAAALASVAILGPENPLRSGERIGPWPLLDVPLTAYAAPALLLFFLARLLDDDQRPLAKVGAKGAALLGGLAFMLWLWIELRRVFVGEVVDGTPSDAEQLAHSGSWLALAAGAFAYGVLRGERLPRLLALALACAASLKVTLFDLAQLDGLYRALSLIGLGLALIALGWAYRRFVAERP